MITSWQFFAVRSPTPSGFTWHWQKQGAKVPLTSAPFDFYFDCISDARDKGYAGPLPSGPKLPIQNLPTGSTESKRGSAALPPKGNPGQGAMTVTAVSAVESKRRRTHSRSRVT